MLFRADTKLVVHTHFPRRQNDAQWHALLTIADRLATILLSDSKSDAGAHIQVSSTARVSISVWRPECFGLENGMEYVHLQQHEY